MSDIESLRQRIEQAELRLKTAHTARQRESAALTAMWDQIRERFSVQSAEVVRLRTRVGMLEDTRDELQALVRKLLGAVESSVERMADETVPKITGLAEGLLESDPAQTGEVVLPDPPPPAYRPAWEEAAPVATDDADEDFAALVAAHLDRNAVPSLPPLPPGDGEDGAADDPPVSPGIRNLISRIEGSFDRAPAARPSAHSGADDESQDEDLTRDLDDIRRLRDELQSLRTRIGAGP